MERRPLVCVLAAKKRSLHVFSSEGAKVRGSEGAKLGGTQGPKARKSEGPRGIQQMSHLSCVFPAIGIGCGVGYPVDVVLLFFFKEGLGVWLGVPSKH